jgi:hypothetical protein
MTTLHHESRYARVKAVRKSFRVALLVLLLCACLGFLLFSLTVAPRVYAAGGGPQVSIRLSVLDDQNQPVPEARIELRLDERLVATAVTDDAGKADIELPGAGGYVMVVSKKGYVRIHSPLAVKVDDGAQRVEVILPQNALSQQSANVQASDSVKRHLPIEYAADLTAIVAGKEAGASWTARGMEKPLDFSSRKEYSVRASGRTPGKIVGDDTGHARRLDQLVLGETARNQ